MVRDPSRAGSTACEIGNTVGYQESWLISPLLDLSIQKNLQFDSAKAFWTHDSTEILISFDYDGDPTTATWQVINLRLAQESDADHEWIDSGVVTLPVNTAPGVIGFKYSGIGTEENTTSFRIDNISVRSAP